MNLEGMDICQAKTIRGATKIPTELRYRIEVRLLRRRRQIADRHVFDHAAAKRADLSHRKTSCLKGWALTPTILSDRKRVLRLPSTAAPAASFNHDCTFALDPESMLLTDPLIILFQQHRPIRDIRPCSDFSVRAGHRPGLEDFRSRVVGFEAIQKTSIVGNFGSPARQSHR